MRKKTTLIAMTLIIISLFLLIKFNSGAQTIEEAVNELYSNKVNTILHEEKTDKGSIVFYSQPGDDSLLTAIVKKSLGGYKSVFMGVQGDLERTLNRLQLSEQYFPTIEKTPLPIYFGAIGNSDISKVKVIEKKRNVEKQAKIINAKDMRIWLVYMNGLQGSEFDIIGLSAEGKELAKINSDISPYYAEQKPFKNNE